MEIQKKIWDFCKQSGLTDAGAAAVLGNIEAESAFEVTNLEGTYNRSWGISDIHYVELIDAGAREFVDSAGFGYCQWTYGPRKRNLLQFARERGVSIADHDMQMDFMMKELHGEFADVLIVLTTSSNVRECTEKFMKRFENPYDKSEAAIAYRSGLAMKWYDKYCHTSTETPNASTVTYKAIDVRTIELCIGIEHRAVNALQVLLGAWGYSLDVDGIFGAMTKDAVIAFQRKYGLDADGIVGKDTWAKLIGG